VNILALALVVLIGLSVIGAMIIREVQRRTRTPELDRILFRRADQQEEEK